MTESIEQAVSRVELIDEVTMRRREFMAAVGASLAIQRWANAKESASDAKCFEAADKIMAAAVRRNVVQSAAVLLRRGEASFQRAYGGATNMDAMFLLASITKPMCVASLMTLYDDVKFRLDDAVQKFVPEFRGDGRERITVRHLLTHTCGLPDQLPENQQLRKSHAPLAEFMRRAARTPLLFAAGAKYQYSSMGILLAADIAQRISGQSIADFMQQSLFKPVRMKRTVLGLGEFTLKSMMPCQTQHAAPESGAGAAAATDWDWNSEYWRAFGAPWGGAHGTAGDLATFLNLFLHPDPMGDVLLPKTAKLMVRNHNAETQRSRGLGFGVGSWAGSPGCSEQTFGHTGSTGTLCWADPTTNRMCIVLTTLPGAAVKPHPRTRVSEAMAQ